jgi:hypothetical protein
MLLFSLVAIFLIGGFGIFYWLSSTAQPGTVVLAVAIAWCAFFIWLLWVARWTAKGDEQ